MKKIMSLTDEQTARFDEFVKKWTDIGLCTNPADRHESEAAIKKMYQQDGLANPRIIWCGSPLGNALTRAIITSQRPEDSVGDSVGASAYGQHDASKQIIIVAHSETGHHHCLDADKVEMYRLPEEIYECFLVVKEPTPLVHLRPFDTHEPIMFKPGIYRVNRQREYTPQGMRRVED